MAHKYIYIHTHTYIHIQANIFIYLHAQLNRDLVISGNNSSENYAQIGVRLLLELLCTDSLEYQLCLKFYLSLSPSLLELIFKALPCSICYDSSQLIPSSRQTRWIILHSHTNTHLTIHTYMHTYIFRCVPVADFAAVPRLCDRAILSHLRSNHRKPVPIHMINFLAYPKT